MLGKATALLFAGLVDLSFPKAQFDVCIGLSNAPRKCSNIHWNRICLVFEKVAWIFPLFEKSFQSSLFQQAQGLSLDRYGARVRRCFQRDQPRQRGLDFDIFGSHLFDPFFGERVSSALCAPVFFFFKISNPNRFLSFSRHPIAFSACAESPTFLRPILPMPRTLFLGTF